MRIRSLMVGATALAIVLPTALTGAAAAPGLEARAQQTAVNIHAAVLAATQAAGGRVTEARKSSASYQGGGRDLGDRRNPSRGGAVRATPGKVFKEEATAPNPSISETCGLDATLTLDSSGSIGGNSSKVRQAAGDFVNALKDTNSTLRMLSFAKYANVLAARVPVNGTTAGPGGSLTKGVTDYPAPNGGTNWTDALNETDRSDSMVPELLIFVTDGDPTYWMDSNNRIQGSGNTTDANIKASLPAAITAANRVKGKNTRILVVGVGNGLTSPSSQQRLKDISGPQIVTSPSGLVGKTINQVDVAAFTDFTALSAFLRSVVTSLCGNSVTVQKLAQSSANAQFLPATGWNVTVKPTVTGGFSWVDPVGADNTAQTRATTGAQGAAAFQWKPKQPSNSATVEVSEAVQGGFNADRWECDVKKPDGSTKSVGGKLTNGSPKFSFDMASSDVAACRLYNDFIYSPGIKITKVAADDPVRGNGVGWDETYTFGVTNTGNTPLAVAKPVDPKCVTISAPSGPGAPNGRLAPGDTWTYTCASRIGPLQTTAQTLTRQNTVSVIGVPEGGAPVTATATASVDVKTPGIGITKTAKRPAPDNTPIPDGGTVPAGSRVTYVYTLKNNGNDTVKNVAVADNRCSPLDRVSGTGATLAPGDTWIFNCTTRINPPSTTSSVTNTASATANWSNPQNRPQNNGPVTDTDEMTINVTRAANLRVIKSTNPGDVNQSFPFTVSGQGVPAGDTSFDLNTSSDPATPPATRNIALDGPDGGGSTYTITETPGVAGFDLTDIKCIGGSDFQHDTATGVASVKILPGEDVTCTYTNERLPTLSISKETSPGGVAEEFGFTATRPIPLAPLSPTMFALADGGTRTYNAVAPGQVTITENDIPVGWELDDISCVGLPTSAITLGTTDVTLQLGYGQDVDCLFTNSELPPATLTVVKSGTGGIASPDFDFTASGTGFVDPDQPGSDTFSLKVGDSTSYSVRPLVSGNTYTITEDPVVTPDPGNTDWVLTRIECIGGSDFQHDTATGVASVKILPGDNATCTYTNQRLPRLTILKHVVVGQGQTGGDTEFDFLTGQFTHFFLGDGEAEHLQLIPGQARTVTETGPVPPASPADWRLTSLDCTGTGSQKITVNRPLGKVSGALDYGDDVLCTYVNTKEPKKPALLTVVKQVDPTIDAPAFDYTFSSTPVDPAAQNFSLDPNPQGTASKQFTLGPPEGGGAAYKIEELPKNGWDNTDLACVKNGSPAGSIIGTEVTLNLVPGDRATCTYTNAPKAKLTIVKQESVGQGQQGGLDWGFTTTGLGGATFSLLDGEAKDFADLEPSQPISVTEDAATPDPADWVTTIDCSGPGSGHYSVSGRQVSGTTQSGDDVTCVYVNTKKPSAKAVLTVTKQTIPDTSGVTFGYTFDGTPADPGAQNFTLTTGPDGTDSRVFTLSPQDSGLGGTDYTLDETDTAGWDFSDLTCEVNGAAGGSITDARVVLNLIPGDVASCTYENTQQAQITIEKTVVVGTGQSGADDKFTFDTTNLGPAQFQLGNAESRSFAPIATGTAVAVTEQDPNPAVWSTTVTCSGVGAENYTISGRQVSGVAQAGDDITCTYVNTKEPLQPAVLLVAKSTDPASEPASTKFDFTASGTGLHVVGQPGTESFQLGNRSVRRFLVHPVEVGNDYTVVEAAKSGWVRQQITCQRGSDTYDGDLGTGQVQVPALLPGQVAVCLYDNQKLGSLTITKQTDVATSEEFDFTAESDPAGIAPAAFRLGDGVSQSFDNLAAGTTVTVDEQIPSAAPDRWDLADIECFGNSAPATIDLSNGEVQVTIGAGEDVECQYIDSQVEPATVQIVKQADPADGTEFSFTASGSDGGVLAPDQSFTLTPDGDIDVRTMTVYPAADGNETFTFTEPAVPTDWGLDSIDCEDGGTPVGIVDLGAGKVDVDIAPADTVTCTFTNRKVASLTVVKEAPDDPALAFDFDWTLGDSFTLKDQESWTQGGLAPGPVTVSEVNLPTDWYLDGPHGEHPVCVGTAAAVDYSPVLGATVTIAAGEDVVCTFSDFYDYRPEIQLAKTPDRTVVLEGQPVIYSYLMTNTGNVATTPVGTKDQVVVDDQCSPVTYVSGDAGDDNLDPGEAWTFTCTVAAMTAAKAYNLATATMTNPVDPPNPLTATDDKRVEVRIPVLAIDKRVDQSVVYPGTEVTYVYEVSNVGSTEFEGPVDKDDWVTDDKCSPVTYVSGDVGDDSILEVDETWLYECTSKITADTTNVATVTGIPFVPAGPDSGPKQIGPPITEQAEEAVRVIKKDITVTKSASAPGGVVRDGVLLVAAGDQVTYTYDVTSGTATVGMQVVDIADDKCVPVTYVSGDTNGNDLVDPGETWKYSCRMSASGAQELTNTVGVTAVEPSLGGVSTATSRAKVQWIKGRIRLNKTPNRELVAKGTLVTYTYEATNDGTVDLSGITATDDKCSPVNYVSGDDGDGIMQPGETWVFECSMTLGATTTNVAVVTGTTPIGGLVDATDSAQVQIFNPANLDAKIKVKKTADKKVVKKGGKVAYTYKVSNPGKLDLAKVKRHVTDNKCSRVKYIKGDRDGNGILTSSRSGGEYGAEVWTFRCQTKLKKNTVNTVTAKGKGWLQGQVIGPTVKDKAKAKVRVIQSGGGSGRVCKHHALGWALAMRFQPDFAAAAVPKRCKQKGLG